MTSKTNNIISGERAFQKVCAMGFRVLLKNYECPAGEIDLIAKKDGELVFFAVNRDVCPKFRKAVAYYLKRYGIKDVRFDCRSLMIEEKIKSEGPMNGSNAKITRAQLMEKVRAMGVKNFRVMNKAELAMIVDGAPKAQIEAIQLAAVTRWKAGWSKNKKVAA